MIMRASIWFDELAMNRASTTDSASGHARTSESFSWQPAPKAPTVHLERGSVFSRPLEDGERLTVQVTSGHAWITMEGDARDHVLTSNDEREFAGPGLLVIEGLEQGARVELQMDRA